MTEWAGKFVDPAVTDTEEHQRAQTDKERADFPLPRLGGRGYLEGVARRGHRKHPHRKGFAPNPWGAWNVGATRTHVAAVRARGLALC